MYLLDDVLSAVDSQVGCWILQRALLGPLLNKKTRVMCTHNIQVSNLSLQRKIYQDSMYFSVFLGSRLTIQCIKPYFNLFSHTVELFLL